MIKKYLLTFCLITIALVVHGQTYLGVRVGMNATNLTSSQSDARLGFIGGLTLDTPISENFSLYPGAFFTFNRFNAANKFKPNYALQAYSLEVPLMLSYKLGDFPTQIALDFGPYMRFGLYGKTKISNVKHDTFDDLKNFDLGGQAGLRVLMNEIHIGFNIQYGFIKPSDLYKGNYYTFNLTLGYNFEL